jgi:hypothetical protein
MGFNRRSLRRPSFRRAPAAALAALALTSLAAAAPQVWADQIGTGQGEQVYGITSDGAGGSYETGSTLGDLGSAQVGNGDAFVTRRDAAGQVLWTRQLGTQETDEGRSVAADANGGVFVAGNLRGVLGAQLEHVYDVFVARYGPAGDLLWRHQFGSGERDVVLSATPDGAGGFFLAGITLGSLGAPSAGQEDVWVARVDAAGNTLWLKQFGTDEYDAVARVESDGSGGLLLCGSTTGALGGPVTGPLDIWYARYDGTGNELWLHQFGSSTGEGNSYASGIALADAGDFFLGGTTYGLLATGTVAAGDAFLGRFDGQGNQLWLNQFGSIDTDTSSDIAADGQGGVFAAGASFGEFAGANAGVQDVWIRRFDGAGNASTQLQFGSANIDLPLEIVAAGDDVIACGNSVGDGALFGTLTNTYNGWAARFEACDFGAKSSYCTAGVNSTGNASSLGGSGSPYVANNDFGLFANGLPALETGVFLMGTATDNTPFGNGTLCVGGAVHRLGTASTAAGVATLALDVTDPSSPASQITAGSTWHFQFWYRDTTGGGAGFNLSNGLSATFCP